MSLDGSSESPQAGPSGTQHLHQSTGASGTLKKRPKRSLEQAFAGQDEVERRETNAALRRMQLKAEDGKANLANFTGKAFQAQLKEQEELFDRVQDTANGSIDAKLFTTHTDTANHIARTYRAENNAFDVDQFLLKVRNIMGLDDTMSEDEDDQEDELDEESVPANRSRRRKGRSGNWERIGWMAARYCRRVPGVEFMNGPLKVEHVRRTQTQRQRRTEKAPEVVAQNIVTGSREEKEKDTPHYVLRVGKLLAKADKEGEGINFFRFFINADSFGQSVENMFFTSFLIRDGKAGLSVKDDGELLIHNVIASDAEGEGEEEEPVKKQGVMEFDMETWKMAIETFGIKGSTIPHREPLSDEPLAADKWYT